MLLILIGVAFHLDLLRQWIVDDRWMLFKETSRLSVIYYSIIYRRAFSETACVKYELW